MSRRRPCRRLIVSDSESEPDDIEMNHVIDREEEPIEIDPDLGRNVTTLLDAPFKVYEAEAKLYNSLAKREVIAPVDIDYDYWKDRMDDGDKFSRKFVRLLQRVKLEKWAGIDENAYPLLMREFYTSISISDEGTIRCRFDGMWFKFTTADIMEEFGFYANVGPKEGHARDENGEYIDRDEQYDEEEFWDEIKCLGIGRTEGFPLTAVQCNALYITYRYLAKSVFGKEKIAKIPKEDLYLLWKIKKWRDQDLIEYPETRDFRPINLYPYILATIKNTCRLKVAKNSKLSLGAFITCLAKRKGWNGNKHRGVVEPVPLPMRERLLRTPMRPEGKKVPITFLRKRTDDEDADLKDLRPRPQSVEIFATEMVPPVLDENPPAYQTRARTNRAKKGKKTAPEPSDRSPEKDRSTAHRSPRIDHTTDRSIPMDRSPTPPHRSPSIDRSPPSIDRSPSPMDRSTPTPIDPPVPLPPLVFDVPIMPTQGRTKKNIERPGQDSTLPPNAFSTGPSVARVSFDGPTRKEYDEFKQETRANLQALKEGQATILSYIDEDREWKKEQRRLVTGNRELLELMMLDTVGGVEDEGDEMNEDMVVNDTTPDEP
ncbi:hypothetical protein CASFOL_031807 [Castilleja foliolosa]|uniref:Uncharacterized protein n=1 Tax=Castilleja foliolosa TaxID=1961234 RepID=A0ABD3C1F7_9LAMI